MSSSNCCFLTCIQVSQEAGQVVWYSHLFQNFPQFIVVIQTVKGFGIVNKRKIDVFLELSWFFDDPVDVGNLISVSSAFSKSSLNTWKFSVHVLLKPNLENFEHYFASLWDECQSVRWDSYARGRDRVSLRGEGQSCQPIPTWNKQTLSTSGPRRKEKWPHKRQSQTCLECLALCDMAHRFTE